MKRGKTRRVLSLPSYFNPWCATDNVNGYHQLIMLTERPANAACTSIVHAHKYKKIANKTFDNRSIDRQIFREK